MQKQAREKYEYGATYRPVGFATVPKGWVDVVPHKAFKHGVVIYTRPLTNDEINSFELTPIFNADETQAAIKSICNSFEEYATEYAEMISEGDQRTVEQIVRQRFEKDVKGYIKDLGNAVDQVIGFIVTHKKETEIQGAKMVAKSIHVVFRKRPNKKPFQLRTYDNRMDADEFAHSRPDTYVVTYENPTKDQLALVQPPAPKAPWITPKQGAGMSWENLVKQFAKENGYDATKLTELVFEAENQLDKNEIINNYLEMWSSADKEDFLNNVKELSMNLKTASVTNQAQEDQETVVFTLTYHDANESKKQEAKDLASKAGDSVNAGVKLYSENAHKHTTQGFRFYLATPMDKQEAEAAKEKISKFLFDHLSGSLAVSVGTEKYSTASKKKAQEKQYLLDDIEVKITPDQDADASYMDQEGFESRKEDYRNGDFSFIGIQAIGYLYDEETDEITQVDSQGLWGIESDSDSDYLKDVALEELADLQGQLKNKNLSNPNDINEYSDEAMRAAFNKAGYPRITSSSKKKAQEDEPKTEAVIFVLACNPKTAALKLQNQIVEEVTQATNTGVKLYDKNVSRQAKIYRYFLTTPFTKERANEIESRIDGILRKYVGDEIYAASAGTELFERLTPITNFDVRRKGEEMKTRTGAAVTIRELWDMVSKFNEQRPYAPFSLVEAGGVVELWVCDKNGIEEKRLTSGTKREIKEALIKNRYLYRNDASPDEEMSQKEYQTYLDAKKKGNAMKTKQGTKVDSTWEKVEKLVEVMGEKEFIDALITGLSDDEANFQLGAIIQDYDLRSYMDGTDDEEDEVDNNPQT